MKKLAFLTAVPNHQLQHLLNLCEGVYQVLVQAGRPDIASNLKQACEAVSGPLTLPQEDNLLEATNAKT